MNKVKIVFLELVFEQLKKALKWDGREKAVYLLCHSTSYKDSLKLMPYKVFVPKKRDYVKRNAGYYELSKKFVSKVLNIGIQKQSHFLQCHIHPGDPAIFSCIDEIEELKLMQHIASKIDGIYHASLVFGNSLDTLDGWFYERNVNQVIPLEKVLVIGKNGMETFIPSRSPLSKDSIPPTLDRTIMAFGKEAVQKTRCLDFAVAGLSALGAPISEFLTRDRVLSITGCDPDTISKSSLNRLPRTTSKDVGKPKAEFYGSYLQEVSQTTRFMMFQRSFYDPEVQAAMSVADVLFGCVDSEARLSMNRFANAHLIPYFDLGAGIRLQDGKPSYVGGQVFNVIPGREVCLICTEVFKHLLERFLSPKGKERLKSRGYLNEETPDPLVMFLDYIITGIGYQQMLKYVWRTENQEVFSVQYNGAKHKLSAVTCDTRGCINCQLTGFLGKGDKVPIMVPEENVDYNFVRGFHRYSKANKSS